MAEVRASVLVKGTNYLSTCLDVNPHSVNMSGETPQPPDHDSFADTVPEAGVQEITPASKAGEQETTMFPSVTDDDSQLRKLEDDHKNLLQEHETLRSQYVRIAADFDNFRKRQRRDQDDLKLQLVCGALGEILPVVDNFERARQQLSPESEEAQSLHRSYQGLYKQLVDVLKQMGVAPMRVVGQEFDPTLHEAVMREPSEEHPEDVIIEELQRGYQLKDRVLRHAMVKVSMGPGPTHSAADPETVSTPPDMGGMNPVDQSSQEI